MLSRSPRRADLDQVLALAAESLTNGDPADVQADCAADALIAAVKYRGIEAPFEIKSRLGMVEVSLVPAHVPYDGEAMFCDEFSPAQVLAAARLVAAGSGVLAALDEACEADRKARAHDLGELCADEGCDDCERYHRAPARRARVMDARDGYGDWLRDEGKDERIGGEG